MHHFTAFFIQKVSVKKKYDQDNPLQNEFTTPIPISLVKTRNITPVVRLHMVL